MIDTAMLTRLMVLTGFAPPEMPAPQATKEMLALARAIWTEAQSDERESCAKVCDGLARTGGLWDAAGAIRRMK